MNTYTAVIQQDNGYWIGWIQEVPGVNCQENSRSELMETLKITLEEILEINKENALRSALPGYQEAEIAV